MIVSLIISCVIVGLHIAINEILEHFTGANIEDWYAETYYVDEWGHIFKTWKTHLAKPLFACVTCMSSIWGTFFYVLLAPRVYFGFDLFVWYLPTIFMTALFSTWIYKLFNGTK